MRCSEIYKKPLHIISNTKYLYYMLPSNITMQNVTLHKTQARRSLVYCIRQISTLRVVRSPRSVFYMTLTCIRVWWEKEHGGLSPRSQTLVNRRRHMWVEVREFHISHYTLFQLPRYLYYHRIKFALGVTTLYLLRSPTSHSLCSVSRPPVPNRPFLILTSLSHRNASSSREHF